MVVIAVVLAACNGPSSEDRLALAARTTTDDFPCEADLALLEADQIGQPVTISNSQHSAMVAHVFEGLDDSKAVTVQKFVFASCGGMDVIEEPRVLLGDIAWQRATSSDTTLFGTLAAKQPPRVVVVTIELDCAGESCPPSEGVYELLSAFAYTLAGAP